MADPFQFFFRLKKVEQPNIEGEIRLKAARTLVKVFDDLYEGAFAVDTSCRIIWMNDKFKALIGWNGTEPLEGRDLSEILPHTDMKRVIEKGQPDLIDIVDLGERQITISRIPLSDDNDQVVGAMGVILFDRLNALKPLVSRFQNMQNDLKRAEKELAATRQAKYRFSNFVGNAKAVQELKRQARRAAERDVPVLLLGATGTGKELLAHAIHHTSGRSKAPMVRINVSAIPEGLLEAELFGTASGAYTGASKKDRLGKFQLADGGTLFLDEIGDMPASLQPKLLRVLQERELEPVGSNKVQSVDVRVISATSRNLEKMVQDGDFRADLYYRLNVVPLIVPSLKERPSDLPRLCDVLLDHIGEATGQPTPTLADEAVELLKLYDWPGNVRELRNILDQACARFDDDILDENHIIELIPSLAKRQKHIQAVADNAGFDPLPEGKKLKEVLADIERQALIKALAEENNVKSRAAKRLGISRAQFYEKLTSFGILSE
ncbi:sigma-54 interaction domain-containing protein [Terasakiella sp.]|uniref:sigma-54 interaction domain-containing protein n=1 Tax=Terasakiella sp. TaxID=2034861 RepID=UPI003AA9D75C